MRDLFSSLAVPPKIGARRRYAVPLSIATHAAIIGLIIVVPLTVSGAFPTPSSVLVFTLPPASAPPPPAIVRAAPAPSTQPRAMDVTVAPVDEPSVTGPEPAPAPSMAPLVNIARPSAAVDVGIRSLIPPPPTPAPRGPVRAGGLVQAPRKIFDVAPTYPSIAKAARVEGAVVVEAIIGKDGVVRDARVLESIAMLDTAALEAVRLWRYTPTTLNGEAVDVVIVVTVRFQLR